MVKKFDEEDECLHCFRPWWYCECGAEGSNQARCVAFKGEPKSNRPMWAGRMKALLNKSRLER